MVSCSCSSPCHQRSTTSAEGSHLEYSHQLHVCIVVPCSWLSCSYPCTPYCRFDLLTLTQEEIDHSNSLLYKMLPSALVTQLKEVSDMLRDSTGALAMNFVGTHCYGFLMHTRSTCHNHVRSCHFQGRSGVSDFVSGVSILFCDIKGFTTISSTIPPKTVVDMLHLLFTGFDRLTDKYQVGEQHMTV